MCSLISERSNRPLWPRRAWLWRPAGTVAVAALLLPLAFAVGADADGKSKPVASPSDDHPLTDIWSGYHYADKSIQDMQDDDIKNPGMAWYVHGEKLWKREEGEAKKACATCHNVAQNSMKGVAARYPIYYGPRKKLINLENRINECRAKFLKAPPLDYESDEMLGLSIFVRAQSRGLPVKVRRDGLAKPFFEKGRAFYYGRRGQFNMACSHCHEKHAGKRYRSMTLSQGQANGFPAYRLTGSKPWTLHKRVQACSRLIRSEPFPSGSDDYVNLELYLAWRGQGLMVETPAVRR
ncbi:MAG: sulfur oxidation c-type cytochrome SoxA [Methyloligellaceae bacterium]